MHWWDTVTYKLILVRLWRLATLCVRRDKDWFDRSSTWWRAEDFTRLISCSSSILLSILLVSSGFPDPVELLFDIRRRLQAWQGIELLLSWQVHSSCACDDDCGLGSFDMPLTCPFAAPAALAKRSSSSSGTSADEGLLWRWPIDLLAKAGWLLRCYVLGSSLFVGFKAAISKATQSPIFAKGPCKGHDFSRSIGKSFACSDHRLLTFVPNSPSQRGIESIERTQVNLHKSIYPEMWIDNNHFLGTIAYLVNCQRGWQITL